MSDRTVVNSLRLKGAELEALLEELERTNSSWKGSSKREMRRWSMHGLKAVLTIVETLGHQRHALVVVRNMSTTGVGCLHGSFLHLGTRCVVSVRDRHGEARSMPGTVVRCKHARGNLHDVGIRFDSPVQPADFREFDGVNVFHRERVEIAGLQGVVLIVEQSIPDQKLMAAYFKESPLELLYARDARTALEMLGEGPDLLIVDHALPDMTGLEFAEKATEAGYAKPIFITTTDTGPALRSAAAAAGIAEVLVKPLTAEMIRQAVAEYLLSSESGRGAIRSVRDPSIINDALVDEYVAELHRLAYELGRMLRDESYDALRSTVNQIRGSALGYGFKGVSDAAESAIRTLDASRSVTDSASELRTLISACQRTVPTIAEANEEPPSEPGA